MKKCFVVALICVALKFSSSDPLSPEESSDGRNIQKFTNETAVNLRPDDSDDYVTLSLREALVNTVLSDDASLNHYTNPIGHDRLLTAIATLYSSVTNERLKPRENVVATVGATEALAIAFRGLTEPGDEWILIEPYWSKFKSQIELAHGVPRYSNLKLIKTSGDIRGSDWELDKAQLSSLFNNKTRGIVLNNPNNPAGKLYTRTELQFIADLAEKWDVVIISDEAYEWAVYEPHEMIRFGSLPGMFNRTVTIGSASKSFIVTGWRIGWAYGPAHLISRLAYVHDFYVQNAPTPQQIAVAYALEQEYKYYGNPYSFFEMNLRMVTKKRDFMAQALRNAGMIPIVPDGGYCMLASWPQLQNHPSISQDFSNWMAENIGILGYPGTHYYGEEHQNLGEKYIRFCYHKRNETLQLVARNLMRLRQFETVN